MNKWMINIRKFYKKLRKEKIRKGRKVSKKQMRGSISVYR